MFARKSFVACAILAGSVVSSAASSATARAAEGAEAAAGPDASATPAAPRPPGLETKFSAMAGLAQWTVLRGGNIAVEYKVGRFAFEVSHGQGLDLNQLDGFFLTSVEREAGAQVRVPWTTGFGVGYRITENLHALIEFKAHHYEVSSRDPAATASYTTFSIGPGVFYSFYIYKGLFLEPNLRFWPNVASTLADNKVALREPDGTTYMHQAHDFGFFANMNLGYSF
jgi:hypothetical protein